MKKMCNSSQDDPEQYEPDFNTITQARSTLLSLASMWSTYSSLIMTVELVASTNASTPGTIIDTMTLSSFFQSNLQSTYPIGIFFGKDGKSIDEAVQAIDGANINWIGNIDLQTAFQQFYNVWNTNGPTIQGMYNFNNITAQSITVTMTALGKVASGIDALNQDYVAFLSGNNSK